MRLIDAEPMRQDWLENGENEYVYDTNDFLSSIDEQPTIDPIHAAGGCYCRECRKYMTPECNLCSFDADSSCTGGPDSDFYCGDSEPNEVQRKWMNT